MPYRILSIDGGGIRGLIPAIVLRELEGLSGRRTHELFDLVVGTSTGALLGLGLTTPDPEGGARYAADDLVSLYRDSGPDIFSRSLTYRARSVNGLTNAKYPASGLERTLERYFGDARLADLLGDVLVPAYETELREPFLLRSRRARSSASYDFALRDAARAATAAPTFFQAARVSAADGRRWSLIDGGVFANNPTMVGIVEAIAADDADDVLSVSLGTGDLTRPLRYERIRSWGLLRWARPLIDVVFDAGMSTVDFQAQQLARAAGRPEGHVRFDVRLSGVSDDIDDAGAANLRALEELADRLLQERAGDLERLAELLDRQG